MAEIISNYHWRETDRDVPDWSDEDEECFTYRGEQYFLSQFVRTSFPHAPAWIREWDSYQGDSFFSGILVRYQSNDHMSDDWWPEREDRIQVATYIS